MSVPHLNHATIQRHIFIFCLPFFREKREAKGVISESNFRHDFCLTSSYLKHGARFLSTLILYFHFTIMEIIIVFIHRVVLMIRVVLMR